MRRQHHVTVFVALALLHTDEHTLAVDVADLERNHFGSPQARPIGHAQCRLVLEPPLRFFFRVTLKRHDIIEHTTFIREPRKLPVVLSPEEVARLLNAAPGLEGTFAAQWLACALPCQRFAVALAGSRA